MADISILSRLINGVQRNVDLSTNTLVVSSIKVGGGAGTELTKTILDSLIAFPTRLAAVTNEDGASLVGIEDAGEYYAGATVEAALQEAGSEIATKADQDEVDDLVTLSGVPSGSTDLGTFTGNIIPDNSDTKEALQALETEIESIPSPFYYAGTWAASTNTPTLADGVGTSGAVYYVTDSGTVDFGAGPLEFNAGDKVAYNGTTWDKWDMTDGVISVNGQTGAVVLDTDDVSEGSTNLYFTDTRARTAAVVDSLAGSQTDQAPSVSAVNAALAALALGSLTAPETAGEAFAANTLFAVRYAKAADAGFVEGRIYKADTDATSVDNFHVIGLVRHGTTAAAGDTVTVYKGGTMAAPSHGFTVGVPIYLDASGALTQTPPSTANFANVKVGMAKDANSIEVQIQIMGVA